MILNHPDELTCLMFLDQQVDRLRAREISAHSLECVACRELLHALARESAMLKRAMHEEDEPAASGRYGTRALHSMSFEFGLLKTNREPRTGRKR